MATDTKPANVVCEGDVCRVVQAGSDSKEPSTGASGPAAASAALTSLLGPTLMNGDNTISTAELTGPGKVLALYFSAHWCPPCRGFTPLLAAWYKAFKPTHPDFDVIFISSDRDEESFKEYYNEMPWLALPFAEREIKAKLSQKFKVQGIPTLIILDASTGALINPNGRDGVLSDPEGINYPWYPKTLAQLLEGPLVDKAGVVVDSKEALEGKVKMIYFSAHWCPPCRRFTPELVSTYEKLKAGGKALEVVFVSGDREEAGFKEYLDSMPWLAIPYADEDRRSKLNEFFEVEGIPTLIILDENNKVITKEGQAAVGADPEGSNFPWHPKPFEELSEFSVSCINEQPVLLVVLGQGGTAVTSDTAGDEARAKELLAPVADATKGLETEAGRPLETFSSAASSCNPCSAFCATALGASNHGEEAG